MADSEGGCGLKQLMSLPLDPEFLNHGSDLPETCRAMGCDGLEVVWNGSDLPAHAPQNLRIDAHTPWHDPAIASVIDRIGPEYLVHELSDAARAQRPKLLCVQTETLRKGLEGR